jgi:hypothetical protein
MFHHVCYDKEHWQMSGTPSTARQTSGKKPRLPAKGRAGVVAKGRVADLIRVAAEHGLLRQGKTIVIRGRMSPALVARAKARTGITSDSELIEAALASLAVADDYGEWLIAQRERVDPAVDLEF